MRAFIRRIYYLRATGALIESHMMKDDITVLTIDQDYEYRPNLQPYTSRRDEIGLFEWPEPDPEIEDQFARAYGVSVDVSDAKPVLVFDFTPPTEPEPVPDERDEALRLLGIDTTGNILEQALEIKESTEFIKSISIEKPTTSK